MGATIENFLTPEQIQRVVALREAATLGRDASDTVMFANFVLTGSDQIPALEED